MFHLTIAFALRKRYWSNSDCLPVTLLPVVMILLSRKSVRYEKQREQIADVILSLYMLHTVLHHPVSVTGFYLLLAKLCSAQRRQYRCKFQRICGYRYQNLFLQLFWHSVQEILVLMHRSEHEVYPILCSAKQNRYSFCNLCNINQYLLFNFSLTNKFEKLLKRYGSFCRFMIH